MLILASRRRAVEPPIAVQTWDINRAGPGWAVSSDGLTAICSQPNFTTILAGPKSYTVGVPAKVYFEIDMDDPQAGVAINMWPGGVLHGIANASAPLNTYLGSNLNSTSFQTIDAWPGMNAWWWRNNINTAAPNVRSMLNRFYRLGIAIDFGARRMSGTVNGTTWDATAAAPIAPGFDLSLINGGDYYIATTGNLQGAAGTGAPPRLPSAATVVTTPPFGFPVPTDFFPWGL